MFKDTFMCNDTNNKINILEQIKIAKSYCL